MTELERIQSDLEKGYTVTRYGTTKALHKQMLDDIKYLNDIAKHNEVLGDVSNRDSKLPDLVLHVGKDGVIQVFDQDNNAVLYEGTEIECKDFISGFNGC